MAVTCMSIFEKLFCPIPNCESHNKIIDGPISLLSEHIYRAHDYTEKLKTAVNLGVIKGLYEKRSAKWLSDHLALKGVL